LRQETQLRDQLAALVADAVRQASAEGSPLGLARCSFNSEQGKSSASSAVTVPARAAPQDTLENHFSTSGTVRGAGARRSRCWKSAPGFHEELTGRENIFLDVLSWG